MMRFRILLHRRAFKFLRELKPEDRRRIIGKLRQLGNFPRVRLDVVKIAGEANTFRLRIGDYRVLFKVYEHEKVIVIVKVNIMKKSIPLTCSVRLLYDLI